jgi:hypothetical protein
MGGALQGTGLSSVYPQQIPWGWNPQLSGQSGAIPPFGPYVPQQLQSLQITLQHLMQLGVVQQQQIQQLLQIVPQQLQQIQHLIQFIAQQYQQQAAYQTPLMHSHPSFFPSAGFGVSLPQIFSGQGGVGQTGYVM